MIRELIRRFRRERDGVVAIEMTVAITLLALGFVGMWVASNSVRNANAAELAVNDVVMTARAIGNIESRSNQELKQLFETVASETLMSSQRVDIGVSRTCGCPTEQAYAETMCELESCSDGLSPARYLDLTFDIESSGVDVRSADSQKNFSLQADVQY